MIFFNHNFQTILSEYVDTATSDADVWTLLSFRVNLQMIQTLGRGAVIMNIITHEV